ncbi:amino acid adenylation domain-containing protein [Pseudomonas fluorescens]|uniref:amino acid adenylation domain-containing protein n=1 Tax=Pseudomonas paracarnis TaxID=2750625 RepID=UPI00177B0576|nr:amino acid adenylation domain-containing protein [Pseudomonas paracarnis]MBD8254355.1 amino acid adenylation domain-containing protein [Pseudomonas fluorescens]MDV3058448.1 amino acid adenylation domain-containing protein [Pseudomonas paracarnis]
MRELTSMQAACWIGRTAHAFLGKVSAHLYAEFDGHCIELERLRKALEQVCRLHPMLRVRLNAEGLQSIAAMDQSPLLEVEDLRSISEEEVAQRLLCKREEWTHQQLDLCQGPAARFCVSLLANDAFRLHVDTDMIAIDPSSFRTLIEDLAELYEHPEAALPHTPSFFDWYDKARTDSALKTARDRDRRWWRERLPDIAPAPTLPFLETPPDQPHSDRLSTWLGPEERQALQRLARERRITLSTLMMGVFAAALGAQTGDKRFRLNVPTFWRPALVGEVERIVGDFANMLILDIDLEAARSLAELCRQLAGNMVDLLEHCAYPGVNLMRDLSRHHGAAQLAPVVFTAGLDLSGADLLSERVRRVLGPMNWVVSQGPQVALDAQVVCADGGILINWDIRLDALPPAWVSEFFHRFVLMVREVAACSAVLDQPLSQPAVVAKPLTALQQAYLLGRSAQMPLGGVAMQEFREYRGAMDPALLRSRLVEMVQRHESLRVRIDAQKLVQFVSDEVQLNLDEVDLTTLSPEEALNYVEARREAYAHALFELDRSPWNVTIFKLPEGQLSVFVRLDALILDGRSIATLMVELFDGTTGEESFPQTASEPEDLDSKRKADSVYWKAKLAAVSGAPRLPWITALDRVGASRYERQSLLIPKPTFGAYCKLGARQRLFKNTTLMALVLEVLSHWLDEGGLCVAVPVAPQTVGAFANRSSFIAINWSAEPDGFAERAAKLQVDVLEGLQHLSFSGVDLARLLFESHGPGPVLPVVITNGFSWPVSAQGSPMSLHGGLTQTPQVAMDIRFSANADGELVFDIDYARAVLEPELVSAVLNAIEKAVDQATTSGVLAVDARAIIEKGHYRFNSRVTEACREGFLDRIATNIFDRSNTKTALISGDRLISYAELGHSVCCIIGALKARGLSRGQVVAICLPRSPEHTMVTLACALTGVIWVPIDVSAPAERLRYLLENCQPDLVVIAQHESVGSVTATPAELLAVQTQAMPVLDDLSLSDAPAYYLYTSGTTGKPKCVVLNNRATANVVGSTLERWAVTERDVFMSVTPLHHDMSVFDVFGCLTAGATLVLTGGGEEKDAVRWNQLIAQHQVTLWCSVPAILEMLLSCRTSHDLKSLRLIAQGGDYIKPAVIAELRELLPSSRLISLGGPTETTIWSIWHEITDDDRALIPYGRPLPGNSYFVLDPRGEHCPAGVVGRLHTAGVNLTLGYLENGELAQSEFVTVTDEHGQAVRAFRTGDCGRYRRDGTLIFDSRVNGYVKVRGVRVSLPDIEIALINHPSLRHVLVVDYGEQRQGEVCIGALYVCQQGGEEPTTTELRNFARQHLPHSHVPTRLLRVDALPLSQNGKPDRQRARSLLTASVNDASEPAAMRRSTPRNKVLDIYLSVLGRPLADGANASVDFISLGLRPQHLKAISARVQEDFSVRLSPGQLLRCRNAQDVERLLMAEGS